MDDKLATQIVDNALFGQESNRLEDAPPSYLILLSGSVPGSMFRLLPGMNRLGRAGDNHIQLLEASLSRHHALVELADDGRARLTDLGSTNGTYLNSSPVNRWEPQELEEGDRIRLGGHLLLKYSRPDPYEEKFQQEMFVRAVTDPLTGLYNRAYFFDQVGQVALRGLRKGLGTAILMLDIDHFKSINDTHGHEAGDRVLREVARAFRQVLRNEDLIARYGGEEFVSALPIARVDQALARAEALREAVAERSILTPGGLLRVTCSIGVAFCPPGPLDSPAVPLAAADHALYVAKNRGRNNVVLAESMLQSPSLGA